MLDEVIPEVASWTRQSDGVHLRPGEAHVWMARTRLDGAQPSSFAHILSEDESKTISVIADPSRRYEAAASRAVLRLLLSRYAPVPPAALKIEAGPDGKPFAADRNVPKFNVSHSHGVTLLAFAQGGEVGVDIERVGPSEEASRLADRFLPPSSRSEYRKMGVEARTRFFYKSMTEQEAVLKAEGHGLSHLEANWARPELAERFRLHDLPIGPRWVATLATDDTITTVRTMLWPGSEREAGP